MVLFIFLLEEFIAVIAVSSILMGFFDGVPFWLCCGYFFLFSGVDVGGDVWV